MIQKAGSVITRQEATSDERLYPLMNFMIAYGRDIPNWEYIQSLEMYDKLPEITLYRGMIYDPSYKPRSRCESWTRCRKVAEYFGPIVLERRFTQNDMVFDTKYLADDLFVNFRWQQEVIIKPSEQK